MALSGIERLFPRRPDYQRPITPFASDAAVTSRTPVGPELKVSAYTLEATSGHGAVAHFLDALLRTAFGVDLTMNPPQSMTNLTSLVMVQALFSGEV